jgi:plastocyanin
MVKPLNEYTMKLIYYFLPALVLCFQGCNKLEADKLQFSASTVQTTVQAGDTVHFQLEGNAEMITFFSGEEGNNYAYSEVPRIETIDKLNLSFETHNQAADEADFSVLVSTDFSGTYDYPSVQAATWTDITDRFTMATPGPWPQGWQASGEADLSDLTIAGKPLYIGFRYLLPPYTGTAAPLRRWWRVQLFRFISETSEKRTNLLADYPGAQWQLIKSNPDHASAAQITSNIFLFGVANGARNEYTVEQWGITKAFATDAINKGTDFGVPVKSLIDAELSMYNHIYHTPGEYEAVFVATNGNVAGTIRDIRRIRIIVE